MLKAGGRVALVGASGSGKSTSRAWPAGLYKPMERRDLFDGRRARSTRRTHLADAVAYVDWT
jgi:ABC-type multidrug transport system fused ATPase/permease subunit